MPDADPPRYVSFDRWDAEHKALRERLSELERQIDERRNRQWTLLITVLAALVLPLLATAVIALIAALHHP